jgi:hypothetical protein
MGRQYSGGSYGEQPYAGQLPGAIRGRATLAGTATLSADLGVSLGIQAVLAGVGTLTSATPRITPLPLPPAVTILGRSLVGVRH